MTRSRKKYPSHGICYGSNAQWKRDMRRLWRIRNRRILRKLLKGDLSPDDLVMLDKSYHNSDNWNEPTDGKVVIFHRTARTHRYGLMDDKEFKEYVEKHKRK